MWDNLSLRQKSDLMRIYLQNGISSLDVVKEHYNSYDNGGILDKVKSYFASSYGSTYQHAYSTAKHNIKPQVTEENINDFGRSILANIVSNGFNR